MADDFPQVADLVADALDLSGTEISNILSDTPFLRRMSFVPSSDGVNHRYITHTSNPTVGFVAETGGRDFDHSVDTTVNESLAILDWSFAVRKSTADSWRSGGGGAAYIAREGLRSVQSAMEALERQIFRDADATNGFTGLPARGGLNAVADAMVVNAGGSNANTQTSVYLIREGEASGLVGVYKGDGPALSMGETIVQNMTTSDPLNYPAYYTPGTAWFGLQVGGAYSVSRICNVSNGTNDDHPLTDDLLAEAYSLHPIGQKPTVIAMSRRSLKELRESRTATNPTGAPAPFPSDWEGIPIVVTDQISETEAVVS